MIYHCCCNPLFFQSLFVEISIHPNISETDAIGSVQTDLAQEVEYNNTRSSLSYNHKPCHEYSQIRLTSFTAPAATNLSRIWQAKATLESKLETTISQIPKLGIVDIWNEKWQIGGSLFLKLVQESDCL